MVVKMKMVNIVGDYGKLDETINACIDAGCYHAEPTADVMADVKGFSHINEENPYSGKLHKLNEIFEHTGITPVYNSSVKESISAKEIEYLLNKLESDLHTLQEKRQVLQKKNEDATHAISNLEHFYSLDVELNELYTSKYVKVRFGRLPFESFEKIKAYRNNPYIIFFPCSSDQEYYWGIYVAPISRVDEVDRIFASLFFEQLRLPKSAGTPEETTEFYKQSLKQSETELKELDDSLNKYFSNHKNEIMLIYSQLKRDHDSFEIRRYASKYNHYFMLIGWIPENQVDNFSSIIDEVKGIEVEYDSASNFHRLQPPTKLKNHKPFRPFEYFVEMYGMPNYKEFDPTVFVAITYTLLFGIMFADVGQGIIILITGFLMHKLKNMPLGKILIPCGISSTIFGLIFGSVFGFEHVLEPLYKSIGFEEKPINVMDSATTIIGFSIGLGIVLIIIAMLINVYSSFKRGDVGGAIFGHNGIAGIALYMSILTLVIVFFFGFNIKTNLIINLGIVIPIIIIFLKQPLSKMIKRKSMRPESWVDFIIENFFEMFEIIISYLTNSISFMRVGAFVLIHAGMMMAFFSLAEMLGGGIPTVIMIIFGNIFVTALEGLLVGIQALRLEFYEMFSRFYIGDGYSFDPVKIRT